MHSECILRKVSRDRVRKEETHSMLDVAPIGEKMQGHRLWQFGHVTRRPIGAPVRLVQSMYLSPFRRKRVWPKKTWLEVVCKI